jgi:ribosome recycling factor
MMGEKFDSEPIQQIESNIDSGVPRPGVRVSGTLAEVFGFTITDEARETYAKNMAAIAESEKEADRILRTI